MIDITYIYSRTVVRNGKQITIDSYKLPPFKILLIGTTGTGKTSLLTCMYEAFNKNTGVNFAFEPDKDADEGKTFTKIENQLIRLARMIEAKAPGEEYIDDRQQIAASSSPQEFFFKGVKSGEATFHDKEFHYHIQFKDVPGGWYNDPKAHHDIEIQNFVESADAYLYCIDTPAMMTGGGKHKEFNNQTIVSGWLQKAAANQLLKKKSIIFVLSRSEAWQSNEQELKDKFKQEYGSDINLLKQAGATVYMTPVYTLGGVNFTRYNQDGLPLYKKVGVRKPGKCNIPLIQLLHDGMDAYEQKLKIKNAKWTTKVTNSLGITHFDLAEKCARALKQRLFSLLDKSIAKYS